MLSLIYVIKPHVKKKFNFLRSAKEFVEHAEEKVEHILRPSHTYHLSPIIFTIPLAFATGILTQFILATFIQYVLVTPFSQPALTFPQLYFPLIWLLSIGGILLPFFTHKHLWQKFRIPSEVVGMSVLIVGLAIGVMSVWNFRSPTSLNWDLYQHQLLARILIQDKFDLATSNLSDTFGFDSYPPTFHLPLATAQWPFALTPQFVTTFWQATAFFHLIIVGFASYLFARSLVNSRWLAVLAVLTGMIIFDSVVSFTNLFLLPQTLSATLFSLAYAHICRVKLSWWKIGIYLLSIGLLHYVVGTLAVTILLTTAIAFRTEHFWPNLTKHFPFIAVFFLLCLGAMLISPMINLNSLNQGEAALYNFNLMQKWEFAQRIYGWLLIIFLPLSLVSLYQEKNKKLTWTALIFLGLLTILLAQLPYMLKFFVIARFFMHFFIALGMWSVIKTLAFHISKAIATGIIAIMLVGVFGYNLAFWKHGLNYQNQLTHISQSDLEVAEFLQQVYVDQPVLMVSDPTTQFILEGFSGVNSPAGVYMTPAQRTIVYQALTADNPVGASQRFNELKDKLTPAPQKRLLVISARTLLWLQTEEKFRNSFDFNIWSPRDFSWHDQQYLEQFDQSSQFKRVFSNTGYGVYEF